MLPILVQTGHELPVWKQNTFEPFSVVPDLP
jgi:hypothetical protein